MQAGRVRSHFDRTIFVVLYNHLMSVRSVTDSGRSIFHRYVKIGYFAQDWVRPLNNRTARGHLANKEKWCGLNAARRLHPNSYSIVISFLLSGRHAKIFAKVSQIKSFF
jgi:hypothetical protein